MKRVLLMAAFAGCAALAATASAQVFVYDGFNYTFASALAGQNGGTGFSGAYADLNVAAPSNDTISTPLTYPGLAVSGNSVFGPNDSLGRIFRNLSLPVTGNYGIADDKLYASFLIQPGALATGFTAADVFGGVSFVNNNTGGAGLPVFVGDIGGFYGLQEQGGAGQSNASTKPVVLGDTALLIVRYTFGAGSAGAADTLDLFVFVNPEPILTEPITPDATITMNTDFNRIELEQFGRDYRYDELRIGKTFASVAPVPEPSVFLLTGVGVGGLLLFRRLRSSAAATSRPS